LEAVVERIQDLPGLQLEVDQARRGGEEADGLIPGSKSVERRERQPQCADLRGRVRLRDVFEQCQRLLEDVLVLSAALQGHLECVVSVSFRQNGRAGGEDLTYPGRGQVVTRRNRFDVLASGLCDQDFAIPAACFSADAIPRGLAAAGVRRRRESFVPSRLRVRTRNCTTDSKLDGPPPLAWARGPLPSSCARPAGCLATATRRAFGRTRCRGASAGAGARSSESGTTSQTKSSQRSAARGGTRRTVPLPVFTPLGSAVKPKRGFTPPFVGNHNLGNTIGAGSARFGFPRPAPI